MGGGGDHVLLNSSGTTDWIQYIGYPSDWSIPETMDTEIKLYLSDGEWNTHVLYVDDFFIGEPFNSNPKSITSSYNLLSSSSIESGYSIDKDEMSYCISLYNILTSKTLESKYNIDISKSIISKYIITKHIENGDFETGVITGWDKAGTRQELIFVQTASTPHSGTYHCAIAVLDINSWNAIRQYLTPVKSVSVWVKSRATNSYVAIIDNHGNSAYISDFIRDNTYHQYTMDTSMLNRYDMWLISTLVSRSSQQGSDSLFVDDFTYEELPPYKMIKSDYNIMGGKSITTYFNVNHLSIPVIISVTYPNISNMGGNTWL